MDRTVQATLTSFAIALLSIHSTGCGQSASTETAQEPSAPAASPATEAAASAAADFLDAVLHGDTQRASARLTPQAIERIIDSGKQFAPPGLETATFRLGDVRMPAQGQAVVQCVLTDTSAPEGPREEEMCCLMRLVEDDWRVSGIAYGSGPDQPWTLSDFETGQNVAIPRQPMSPASSGTAAANPPVGRPSPPRTAQEPSAQTVR